MRVAVCSWLVLFATGLAPPVARSAPDAPPLEKGTFRFAPLDDQKDVPEAYRLQPRTVRYEMQHLRDLPASEVRVFQVRFPSGLPSPHPENNTVHAEYYRPLKEGRFP